ncbi:sterol desaturase family protein [Thermodesulfobacteriota bacterium]
MRASKHIRWLSTGGNTDCCSFAQKNQRTRRGNNQSLQEENLLSIEAENLKLILYWSGLALFLMLELISSYRQPSVSKLKRWLTNVPLSITNGVLYHLFFSVALTTVFIQVENRNLGLLNTFEAPIWLKYLLAVLLLDGVIYMWHLVNHEVPLFWRFHRVHHADMNMDVSTASRFHFGEILLSGLVRLTVIYAFGIPLAAYLLFEILVNLSIEFHHSSIRIHKGFEQLWITLFVPPSMHRIHHSVKIKERDSNYGVLFSFWDRLFGTFTRETEQKKLIIGIGSHHDFSKLGFIHMLALPFTRKSR